MTSMPLQVEENSTYLRLWEANTRLLLSPAGGNMTGEGKKRKEIKQKNWKAVS